MNDSYTRYIENRLKEGNKKSNQHLCAITAVDYYGAEEDFYLLQFYNSECLLLKCKTSDNSSKPKRVGIVSCSKYQHGLNEIYKNDNKDLIKKYEEAFYKNTNGIYQYDPFYNELSSALSEYKNKIEATLNDIQFAHDLPVYVCYTKHYSTKAVAHALQEKWPKVILMQEVKENLDIIESKRVLHLRDFSKMYLNTVPVMSVADCFSPQTMYIPVSEFTLDSEFCNGKKWRDLIANTETDDCCIINGIQCKCVTIKMKIDIFNNVFCTTQSFNGEQKTILLHNALGVKINVNGHITEKEPLVMEEKEQVQSINEKDNEIIDDKDELFPKRTNGTEEKKNNTTGQPKSPSKGGERIYKLVEEIDIMQGDTGHSYRTLFGDYLTMESTVVLSEPYLVYPWQWDNLDKFISFLIEIGRVKTFTLNSKKPDTVKLPDYMKSQEFICNFNNNLKSIKNNLSKSKLNFKWELTKTHKRFLDTNDYYFEFDHGLHLYDKCEENAVLTSPVFLKCKENHIKVYKKVK